MTSSPPLTRAGVGFSDLRQWCPSCHYRETFTPPDAGAVEADLWVGASRRGVSKSTSRQPTGFGYNIKKLRSNYEKWLLSVVIKTSPFAIQSVGCHFSQALLLHPLTLSIEDQRAPLLPAFGLLVLAEARALETTWGLCNPRTFLSCLRNVLSILLSDGF